MSPRTAPEWLDVKLVHGVGIAALVGLGTAVWFLGMGPAVRSKVDSQRLLGQINSQKIRLKTLEDERATLERLVAALEKSMASGIELGKASEKNIRLAALAEMAERTGLVIDEIKPGETSPGELYDTHAIEMRGRGKYASCARFLHELVDEFSDMAAVGFKVGAPADPTADKGSFRFDLAWYSDPAGAG